MKNECLLYKAIAIATTLGFSWWAGWVGGEEPAGPFGILATAVVVLLMQITMHLAEIAYGERQ